MDARRMKRQRGKLHKLTVRFPENLYYGMQCICDENDMTIASFINDYIQSDVHQEIRDKILAVKESNYMLAIRSAEMDERFKQTIEEMKQSSKILQYFGNNFYKYMLRVRNGEIPKSYDDKYGKIRDREITLSDFLVLIDMQLKDAYAHMKKIADNVDEFYDEDLCYVRSISIDRPVHRTKNTENEGHLYCTVVRIPENIYKEITDVCNKLSISVAEYINYLPLNNGEKILRQKLKRLQESNYWTVVAPEIKDMMDELVKVLNANNRQLRIAMKNVEVFLRDIDADKIPVKNDMIVMQRNNVRTTFRDYIVNAQSTLNEINDLYRIIAGMFSELLFEDPDVLSRAGKRKIIDEITYMFGDVNEDSVDFGDEKLNEQIRQSLRKQKDKVG